jgi:hypothetical protein
MVVKPSMPTRHGFLGRLSRVGVTLACLTAPALTTHALAAQRETPAAWCACDARDALATVTTDGREEAPGLLWRGLFSPHSDDIASMLAPVLWFSADEPLLNGLDGPIPGPAPCDRPSTRAVVYYQIVGVHLTGDLRVAVPIQDDLDLFGKARGLVVKFFFYYPWDRGLHPHRHDLEAMEVEVDLRQRAGGCRELRIRRVTGLAHGVSWYSNILTAAPDMKLPLTMLIEAGKHAVCPDRNADGLYTPGYDVNARVRDAWGIRDVIATGRLLSVLAQTEWAKPRRPQSHLLPPIATVPICVAEDLRAFDLFAPEPSLGRYELRRAESVPPCPSAPDASILRGLRRQQRFGAEHPATQYRLPIARELKTADAPTRFVAGVAMRWDEGAPGVSVMMRGFDLGQVWAVPRIGYARRASKISAELLVTRSASRAIDPYVSVGYERANTVFDLEHWTIPPKWDSRQPVSLPPVKYAARDGLVTEAGLKFRLRVPGRTRWAMLGYQFGGVRLGMRVNGVEPLANPRFVVEIGPGAW